MRYFKYASAVILICSMLPNGVVAQNSSSNYIEPGYQLTPILGNPGSFIEIEAGKQLSGGISYGAVVHFLVSDIESTSDNLTETISSFWYVGPRIQYSTSLNNNISLFTGFAAGIGSTNYEETEPGLSVRGGFVIGFRPEIGLRFRVSDLLDLNIGTNLLYGYINSRSNLTGAPALRVGFRLGR